MLHYIHHGGLMINLNKEQFVLLNNE